MPAYVAVTDPPPRLTVRDFQVAGNEFGNQPG
jgi:hypothetical protein